MIIMSRIMAQSCHHTTVTNSSLINSIKVDDVIERLNPRGVRESELAVKLTFERDNILRNLRKFPKMGDRLCRKFGEAKEGEEEAEKKVGLKEEEPMDVDGDVEEKKKAAKSTEAAASLNAAMDLTIRDQGRHP